MRWIRALLGVSVIVVMSACNLVTPLPTPTAEALVSETPSPTPSPTETAAPTLTPTEPAATPVLLTPEPTAQINAVPTMPEAEPTEGPYRYIIRPNDTLGFILQLQPWGYPPFDPGVIAAVVRLNNLPNENILPPPGSELLIPRRTPTPIPVGADATATSDANLGTGQRIGNVTLPQGAVAGCYTVVEGDSLISIADRFNTTLETLSQLNQNLNWTGCRFSEYSGGPNCRPFISVGQCVNVPLPTPTPVPSPTPSGRETPTPTPTYAPARGFYPPNGAVAPGVPMRLEWVSVGVLRPDEVYLVEFQNITTNTQSLQVTRNTFFLLPESLIPTDGQTHEVRWRVSVASRTESGAYQFIGGVGDWRTFQWRSR